MARATVIQLTEEERNTLLSWIRAGTTGQRLARRARMILLANEGKKTQEIAEEMNTHPGRVSKWRTRFGRRGIEGLKDAPRTGPPRHYDESTERRILAVLDETPPKGPATWTGTLVAERLGDVSEDQVWRVLRRHGICLQRRRSWCISTGPEFAPKAADIVGLYLAPPENAIVICVDEKPHIQALERAQGWLRLPNGKALTGYNHGYKRHGTTTLFAALETATGLVNAGHFNRRRRREFLAFMNDVTASYPGQDIHVILDNLKTHKPKRDRWVSRRKNVHLHYAPTHASWLNQIEIWFGILSRRAHKGAGSTSPRQVREAIDRFVEAYNQNAAPFEWKKRNVYPKHPKTYYFNLCK